MKTKVSRALAEIWEIKEKLYLEVAHLPMDEALKKRLEDADRTVRELGLQYTQTQKIMKIAS